MGTQVRFATADDMSVLLRMGKSFFDKSGYASISNYNIEAVEDLFLKLIDSDGVVTDGESGMLAFVQFPLFFDPESTVVQELFWWVDEDKRGNGVAKNMLSFVEEEAKQRQAKAVIMLNINDLDGDAVANLYQRLGYKKAESMFMRSI